MRIPPDVPKELVEKLKKEQIDLSKKLNLKDKKPLSDIRYVAGIDVTFTNIWENPTTGIACITVLDTKDNFKEVETVFATKKVDFPYIPTFLAYRELPVILEAYKKLSSKPDAFIVDGMGILHPRKMGIASHFGVITDTICIGCGKSKLVGDFQEPPNNPRAYRPVYVNGEIRGYVVRSKKNTNPIFVSPGNNISLQSSVQLALRNLNGYKLPEPTRLAHNKLQAYRKEILKNS
ncbi:MAG: endonuclease V [Aquificae bacterium]|nr:endonuclease V [Aquificota bacterium]